ncbi:hypothetical protein [Deinococcus soli (ex Cha et al. 2016)]|uniref:Uncharacterized protein n=2 Tax=Deinococcus soli (ex Cha et al. 2016) TaxID=1309411 RepID=A0ACC6KH40_9DEIO|nr:hypothetical protein [Deinococcus soli (ex Cha et al. 2016)]MDR6218974.1 hypothetical protein [Deinococcus soli (ex Cha et al. 2016)]MDR6328771.1 hypothetical protein [Deinococcus soli (ex Cha et al. 2016)]MDR6751742.1 hypothetical protein [Deinococcus soli (ex Cha et al. 2016)]
MIRAHLAVTALLLLSAPAAAQAAQPTLTATPATQVTVTLDLHVPGASALLVAQSLPPGVTVLPGSSRLNGAPTADPQTGRSGRLYWTALEPGELTFTLSGPATLPPAAVRATYPHGDVLLQGTLDPGDLSAPPTSAAPAEPGGLIKSPAQGDVLWNTDSVSVTLVRPLSGPPLLINGAPVPDSRIGTRAVNTSLGEERVTYVAVPLQDGVNTLSAGDDHVQVTVPGAATRVRAELTSAVADGRTPLRARLHLLDRTGQPARAETITLSADVAVLTPDADPLSAGHQVRVTRGVAEVDFAPLTTPRTVSVTTYLTSDAQTQVFTTHPDAQGVLIGRGTVTAALPSGEVTHASGALTAEAPVLGGKLFVHADSAGLDPAAGTWTAFGDASTPQSALPSRTSVAALLDTPTLRVQYGLNPGGLDHLATPPAQGVTVTVRDGGELRAFAQAWPTQERQLTLQADGSRLYPLRVDAQPGSVRVWIVHTEQGAETSRELLTPGADYVTDVDAGLLTLARPLPTLDASLRPQHLLVAYAPASQTEEHLVWGVELAARSGNRLAAYGLTVNGDRPTFGVRLTQTGSELQYDARALLDPYARVTVTGSWAGAFPSAFSARYQQPGYQGPEQGSDGFSASYAGSTNLSGPWGMKVDARAASGAALSGNVSVQGTYTVRPVTVGAGLRGAAGTPDQGLTLVGSADISSGLWKGTVTQDVPLLGGTFRTVLAGSYRAAPGVTLEGHAQLDTALTGEFGVRSTVGSTNVTASYALPTASGDLGRARFGLDRALPLSDTLTLGVRASAGLNLSGALGDIGGGLSLTGRSDTATGTASVDLAAQGGAWRATATSGGTWSVSDTVTLTGDGKVQFGAAPGARMTVGGAYRGPQDTLLSRANLEVGSFTSRPQFTAEVAYSSARPDLDLRVLAGVRAPLSDRPGLTTYALTGARVPLTDHFTAGMQGGVVALPNLGLRSGVLGVDGSLLVLPGTWVTLGYNLIGSASNVSAFGYTAQGAYLRLDLLLSGGAK